MTANVVCRNCAGDQSHNSVDTSSHKQPWIWALGPGDTGGNAVSSDSQNANINQHSNYGPATLRISTLERLTSPPRCLLRGHDSYTIQLNRPTINLRQSRHQCDTSTEFGTSAHHHPCSLPRGVIPTPVSPRSDCFALVQVG